MTHEAKKKTMNVIWVLNNKKIMKKTIFQFIFVFSVMTLSVGSVFAFDSLEWTARNTSQNNQDATQVGAYPGDVIRFDLDVFPVDGPEDFITIDVSNIIDQSRIIDKGFGELTGTQLAYPVFEGSEMTFFVRVNEQCSSTDPLLEGIAGGNVVRVDLFCSGTSTVPDEIIKPTQQEPIPETVPTMLPKTGASTQNIVMSVIGIFLFGMICLGSFYVSKKD